MGQVLNPLRTEVHTYKPLPQHLFSCEVTPSFPKPGQLVGTVKVLCHGCSWKLLSHSIPWWLITRMMKSSSLLHHPSAQGWWNHLHNQQTNLHKSRVAFRRKIVSWRSSQRLDLHRGWTPQTTDYEVRVLENILHCHSYLLSYVSV